MKKRKFTAKERIEILEEVKICIATRKAIFICGALYDILYKTDGIKINWYRETMFYVPELLHYKPKYFNYNRHNSKVGEGIDEVTAWFSDDDDGRNKRLRVIDMAIARIKSRSKIV